MDVTDYQNNENTMYQCTFRFLSKCYTINHNLKLRYFALNEKSYIGLNAVCQWATDLSTSK